MKKYTCLLRGINVGGKNLISMKELKEIFKNLGFFNVESIGNTGVILFSSEGEVNTENIQKELVKILNIDLKIIILEYREIEKLMDNMPSWFNKDKKFYHSVIFILDNFELEDILKDIEPIDEDIDKIEIVNNVIFWTSIYNDSRLYSKSLYSKLSKSEGYLYISLRNGNTFNKIYEKMKYMK